MQSYEYLEPLFQEIEKALQARLYLVALFATLTVPDICSTLERFNPDDGNNTRYKNWCINNLDLSKFSLITVDDIYFMRCKALHDGKIQEINNRNKTVSKFILIPDNSTVTMINCKFNNDVYLYSISDFCMSIVNSARKWLEKNKDDPVLKKNIESVIRYHYSGIDPIISGVPAIG